MHALIKNDSKFIKNKVLLNQDLNEKKKKEREKKILIIIEIMINK